MWIKRSDFILRYIPWVIRKLLEMLDEEGYEMDYFKRACEIIGDHGNIGGFK